MCNYLIHEGKPKQRQCSKTGSPMCYLHTPKQTDSLISKQSLTILEQSNKIKELEDIIKLHDDLAHMVQHKIAKREAYIYTRDSGEVMAILNGDKFFEMEKSAKKYDDLYISMRKAESNTKPTELVYSNQDTRMLIMSMEVYNKATARSSSPDRLIDSLRESMKAEQQKSKESNDKNNKLTSLYSSKLSEIKDLKNDICSNEMAVKALRNQIANTEQTKLELLNYSKLDGFIRKVIFENTGLTRTEYYRADASAFLKLDAEVINPILTSLNLTPNTLVDFYNKTRAIRNNTAHPHTDRRDITIQSIQKLIQTTI